MWMQYQHDGSLAHNAIVAHTGLVVVEQELGLIFLTSLWRTLKGTEYRDVPTTVENLWQHIIDGCAALNPHITDRSVTATLHLL
jgi:hypothetical protein